MRAPAPPPVPTSAFVTGGSGFLGRNLIRALTARGASVRALARSEDAARVVTALGAEAVRGDLDDPAALEAGMRGVRAVFHCAAFVEDWDPEGVAHAVNVEGTRRVLAQARAAKVDVVVHVSSEAVLVGGPPIVDADEAWPLPREPIGPYPRTKGLAEVEVGRAVEEGLRAVVVRPRFIWGNDDTTVLPRLVDATRQGLLRWFDGGQYLTSTCHVDNAVEGMLCAAARGEAGQIYFLTDGEPVPFRGFVSEMLRTQGVEPPTASAPFWAMSLVARLFELLWRLPLPGRPPVTRMTLHIFGREVTVRDTKAREQIGYSGSRTIEEGLRDLTERHQRPATAG